MRPGVQLPMPSDLLDRFGPPEEAFGPNVRFRTASTIAGGSLVLLGFGFCMIWTVGIANRWLPPGGALYLLLGGGLMTVGAAAVIMPRRTPPTWVFVCSRGLVRARGENWEAIEWDALLRFEDVSSTTVRQCRIVLSDGGEWGFLADYVADFERLARVLQQKLAERQ